MSSEVANPEPVQAHSLVQEKDISEDENEKHIENVVSSSSNLVYDNNDEEPELHARTYFALAAMFLLNLVQVLALQGPPAVVCPWLKDWSEDKTKTDCH